MACPRPGTGRQQEHTTRRLTIVNLATGLEIAQVATGREAEAIAEAGCDEEWRKRLTALLVEGPTFILLDNISRVPRPWPLKSSATARLNSQLVWSGLVM